MTEPDTVFSYNIKNTINEDQFEEQDFTKIKSFNYKKSVVYKKYISQIWRKYLQNTCPIT